MHYRVESAALPKVKRFKNYTLARAFAKSLAQRTPQEVHLVCVSAHPFFGRSVCCTFNRKPDGLE